MSRGRTRDAGWGFGLHEAMDQIGAMLGPLVVALVMYLKGSYHLSFGVLLVPALPTAPRTGPTTVRILK